MLAGLVYLQELGSEQLEHLAVHPDKYRMAVDMLRPDRVRLCLYLKHWAGLKKEMRSGIVTSLGWRLK